MGETEFFQQSIKFAPLIRLSLKILFTPNLRRQKNIHFLYFQILLSAIDISKRVEIHKCMEVA